MSKNNSSETSKFANNEENIEEIPHNIVRGGMFTSQISIVIY